MNYILQHNFSARAFRGSLIMLGMALAFSFSALPAYAQSDGSDATFSGGSDAVFSGGSDASFGGSSDASFSGGSDTVFSGGSDATFSGGSDATFGGGSDASFTSGSDAMFSGGSDATFSGGSSATFNGGSDAVFGGGSDATFSSGGSDATFSDLSGNTMTTQNISDVAYYGGSYSPGYAYSGMGYSGGFIGGVGYASGGGIASQNIIYQAPPVNVTPQYITGGGIVYTPPPNIYNPPPNINYYPQPYYNNYSYNYPTPSISLTQVPYTGAIPSISLTQVPYTGLDLGPIGMTLYWFFLIAWCALAAYLVAVKCVHERVLNRIFSILGIAPAATLASSPAVAFRTAPAKPFAHRVFDPIDTFVLSQIHGRKKKV